jgi:hypothetical protein
MLHRTFLNPSGLCKLILHSQKTSLNKRKNSQELILTRLCQDNLQSAKHYLIICTICPEEGSSMSLLNCDEFLLDCTASHPLRQNSSDLYPVHITTASVCGIVHPAPLSPSDNSLARPGRKQATATEDFEFHISYL